MNYQCSKCGSKGVKLWRQYNTFLEHIELLCLPCGQADQKKELCGDQIGWLVPAAPTEFPNVDGVLANGVTFWGYTSVPDDKVDWWKGLPTGPAAPRETPPTSEQP